MTAHNLETFTLFIRIKPQNSWTSRESSRKVNRERNPLKQFKKKKKNSSISFKIIIESSFSPWNFTFLLFYFLDALISHVIDYNTIENVITIIIIIIVVLPSDNKRAFSSQYSNRQKNKNKNREFDSSTVRLEVQNSEKKKM